MLIRMTSSDAAVRRPTSPPSPPSTQKLEGGGWTGWDEPKPDPPPQPKRVNPRWPTKNIPRKTVWPKNRDMKAPPTDDGQSEGGISFKSDSNGDPDYDVKKLMDWNGDWLPPPVEWSARNSFSDRHFGAGIERWINGHDASCTIDLTDELGSPDYLGIKVRTYFTNCACFSLWITCWIHPFC